MSNNAGYRSVLVDKVPNNSGKKSEVQEFQLQKGLYFEDRYTRKVLLEQKRIKIQNGSDYV